MRRRSHLRQGTPDVALKDYDNHQNDRSEKIIQNPIEREKSQHLRSHVSHKDHHKSNDHLHGPSATNHMDHTINDEGDQAYIQSILPAQMAKDLKHGTISPLV